MCVCVCVCVVSINQNEYQLIELQLVQPAIRLVREGFGTDYGLFASTPHGTLYPSPFSGTVHSNHLQFYEFLGRVLVCVVLLFEPRLVRWFAH
jgi:hypothetical protein